MPSTVEINAFLDWLMDTYRDSGFVMAPRGQVDELPWVEEFAWIAKDYIYDEGTSNFTVPLEEPRTGDSLFLVTRNIGLTDCEVAVSCKSDQQKLLFVQADAEGGFSALLHAFTNAGAVALPDEAETVLTVASTKRRTDFVRVRGSVVEVESDITLNEHNRNLAYRFP